MTPPDPRPGTYEEFWAHVDGPVGGAAARGPWPAYAPHGYPPYGWPLAGPPSTPEERSSGMLAHLLPLVVALAGLPFLAWLPPLLVRATRGRTSPFVHWHATESLNFHLSLWLYGLVGIAGTVATLGIGLLVVLPAGLVLALVGFVCMVAFSVRAHRGELVRYPLRIRFLR